MPPPRYSKDPFGPTVERLLAERGWSKRGLAAELGIEDSHLSRVTTGKKTVSLDLLVRVAAALDVEPDYFYEFRQNAVTEHLRRHPELVDRLYQRLKKEGS
jgi:transcriptional regulator with XRE-family HTH domain